MTSTFAKHSTNDIFGEKPPRTNKTRLDKVSNFDSSVILLRGGEDVKRGDARYNDFNSSALTTEDASHSRLGPYNSMSASQMYLTNNLEESFKDKQDFQNNGGQNRNQEYNVQTTERGSDYGEQSARVSLLMKRLET